MNKDYIWISAAWFSVALTVFAVGSCAKHRHEVDREAQVEIKRLELQYKHQGENPDK